MYRRITRKIAAVLCLILFISMAPSQLLLAGETGNLAAQESLGEAEGVNGDSKVENGGKDNIEAPEDSAMSQETQEAIQNQSEGNGNGESNEVAPDPEIRLNYLYVERPLLETPDTQNVVVSWGDGAENISQMTVIYEKNDGTVHEMSETRNEKDVYIFEKSFTAEDTGTYEITGIKYIQDDIEYEVNVKNLGIDARFGINEEYPGFEQGGSEVSDPAVEASVVSVDESDIPNLEEDIETAIGNSKSMVGDAPSNTKSRSFQAKAGGGLVVVLDPGHGGSDSGAVGNGLYEKNLTLKIANYLKQELESYSGVTVRMTRTTDTAVELYDRVAYAASCGADLFVSVHLNSAASSTAYGAEVYYPNTSWKPGISNGGKSVADKILKELVALGLTNRGIKIRSSENGSKYPDGSLADYYAVIKYSKEFGFPGLIIEHAFISNTSDANKYLKTEAGLKSLGVADATGIAQYFGLSKGYWKTEGGKKYYYRNNQKVYGEQYIDSKWYYFSPSTGEMLTGLQNLGSKTVYYSPSTGQMQYGEQKINGEYYFFSLSNGGMATGIQKSGGKTAYYDVATGKRKTGEQYVNGKWYYFRESDGAMQYGLQNHGTKTTYYDLSTGQMQFGEKYISGSWYYFKPGNGAMQTGKFELPSKTVYYDLTTGKMRFGEIQIGDAWFYFKPGTGAMQTGLQSTGTKKAYYDLDSGKRKFGEIYIGGKWYYFRESDGAMQYGLQDLGTKTVYYDSVTGQMQFGERNIGGKWYYFKIGNGTMQTGFVELSGKKVYYDDTSGQMLFGERYINGKWYYLKPGTGAMQTGIQHLGSKTVYYDEYSGQMQFGEKNVNGKWYYFQPGTGAMRTGLVNLGLKTAYYHPSTGIMQFGEKNINGKWYYFKIGNGAMQTGIVDLATKTVYYSPSTGQMQFGQVFVSGNEYYFSTINGAMIKNRWVNGKYYGPDGICTSLTSIAGVSTVTATQLANYYANKKGAYPSFYKGSDAPTLLDFCRIYVEEASREGIRVEVAFTQAMKETGWLAYGGAVDPSQYNFAGIGATDGGAKGHKFASVRQGIRGQIQHLHAYASTEGKAGLKSPCVDPRYDFVNPHGNAPYVEWLGIKENPSGSGWASSPNYGIEIVQMMYDLKNY